MYGPVPVEVALFADGGVAWSRADKPSIFGGSRQGVGSAGVAFRVNVMGVAVAQLDFAHPFQRATQGSKRLNQGHQDERKDRNCDGWYQN